MRRINLPSELNRFVGRAAEQHQLARLLDEFRLVTVVGVGGVGKSRLALRTAAALQKRYVDGVALAELSALRDPALVGHALVDALGLTDHTRRGPRQVLLEHLADRRTLLVVDGFEHLVARCAGLLRELLLGCPGLTVLAVGRRPLRVDGEAVFALAPLAETDALDLLARRAAEAGAAAGLGTGPGGGPGALDDPAVLLELCRRLDGIPLALELAAARLPLLTPDELLRRLEDRFRLLDQGRRGALPRHRTLRTAIGWSHELCTPAERLLWARLSVFAGPFDLEAVEYVCGGPELPADRVLDVFGELLAQSLVTREETAAGPRFRMLETVRAYGAEWLAALGDTGRLRRRHRDWYMGLATWCELEWFSPRQAEVAAVTDVALPNLRAALDLCLESPEDTSLAQHLAGTLWFAWVGCGRLAEGRHWLDRALGAPPHPSAAPHEDARLKALWVLGYVAVLQGDRTAAVSALHECGERAGASGNALAEAYATHRMGCLALLSDELPRAAELIGAALDGYRELGELNSNVLMAQVELAMARAFQGDLPGAVALCAEVREVCEERGERWTKAYALYVLAYAALHDGDPVSARELLAECVTINHTFRDLVGLVLALELLALVTVTEGDPTEAALLQGATMPVWESVGLPLFGSAHFNGARALAARRAGEELGGPLYAAWYGEGELLPLDAAVDRALAGRRDPAVRDTAGARAPRPFRTGRAAVPDTRKPAGSPSGKGGEAAG
ncbi:ATP-binding protein [Streptomyces sp. NPDC090025]|uniref:ATP-binding protein n=1 Tax=Streptomyces sp. NPDC090025 TaxID=3365922 RepID=UPI0038392EC9